jgi:hypothetical protein
LGMKILKLGMGIGPPCVLESKGRGGIYFDGIGIFSRLLCDTSGSSFYCMDTE